MFKRRDRATPEPPTAEPEDEALAEGTLVSHLVELRNRLLRAMLAVLLVFVALVPFAERLFTLVATPLMRQLPEGASMVAIGVASPFLTPFKLAFFCAIFVAMPVVIYQIWAFVAPGLYRREKRLAVPLLVSSILLFYLGIAFAYYIVFPLMFAFFTAVAPAGVTVSTDIGMYLDFVLTLFFAFGLAFEVPIATVLMVWTGFTTVERLGSYRAYVFLGCFVLGMLLTPPDIISQTLLAVPVYILYEVGLIMARLFGPERRAAGDSDPDTQTH
ncbi:MAG: twin-arginine translocase subunit TatC [Gammaproteobacteria bacterium]|nr:MAG: twin-arginine translocase subunit TatC [Gammaproteobacteria bacterium]